MNGLVDRDPRQPSCEARLLAELIEMPEGLDERVLHGFFGVLDVSENSQRYTKDAPLMPSNKRLETPPFASQHAFHEEKIVLVRDVGFGSLVFLHCHNMRQVLRSKRFNECSEF